MSSDPNFFRLLNRRAREMREQPTSAERALHQRLLLMGFDGDDIKTQHVIAPYIYDIYVKSLNLLIEADGLIHARPELQRRDKKKEQLARRKGFLFIRLSNYHASKLTASELLALLKTS